MAVLGLSDITTTVISRQWNTGGYSVVASLEIAAGSYGTTVGGLLMPSYSVFGLRRQIDLFYMTEPVDASAAQWIYRYSATSHAVHVFAAASSTASAFSYVYEIASGTALPLLRFRVAVIGR